MLHLKLLEKQEQAKPKTRRGREIIKIRAKINEIETTTTTTKNTQRLKKTKNWIGSLKKINKIDKPLANLTKMREKNPNQ
jgi:hypothetical protein